MNKWLRWILVVVGIAGLIAVRVVEDEWFYDPFIQYFKGDYRNGAFPDFNWFQLILGHCFRFVLNLLFSAMLLHLLFLNRQWTLQGILLMVLVFAITFPIYLFCIYTKFEMGYLFSFYMRRFVIQPLILLLIIPMFYYRKHLLEHQKKN